MAGIHNLLRHPKYHQFWTTQKGADHYGYDNLNRLVSKNLPGSDPDATYGYNLMGMPLSAVQDGQTLTFTYDALGRKTGETIGYLGTTTFAYDAAGRRTSMTYPGSALTVNYDHDVVGNITAIRENGAGSGVGVLASYAFDNLGRRTSVTFGNGSAQSFAYDPVSRLSTLTNDLNGGATTHDLTQSFAFNSASQIASATRGNDAYAWGGHHNVDRGYTANGLNQLTAAGGVTLGYDARGNLTRMGSFTYGYNSENMMTSGPGGTTLAYDPVGRLKYKVGGGVTNYYGYDGVDLITELDPGGTPLRRYVHGPGIDNPIVWYEGNAINSSTRRFLMADERGSVVSVTDSANATIAINSYNEYGVPAAGNVGRFGYTGQTWLPEVELWNYKARVYSPTLGRFMQTDPIGYADGMNWYNYVGSEPVNFADPFGLAEDCAVGDSSCEIVIKATKKVNAPTTNAGGINIFARGGHGPGPTDVGPSGDMPQNNQCTAPPISPAEAANSRRGDRAAFWRSRAARGDPMGEIGRSIANDRSDFSGTFANSRLRGAIFARNRAEGTPLSYSAAQAEVQQIGVELMRAHVNAVNTFGNPSAGQIAAYHFQVFGAHRLPNSTFGGSMLTGTETEAQVTSPIWLGC